MDRVYQRGLLFLQFKIFKQFPEVVHAVTTRRGGCSTGLCEGLNLGFTVGDVPERVMKNRSTVASALGCSLESLVTARQVHGSTVKEITASRDGREASTGDSGLPQADGLVTGERGLVLMITLADCFSVFLYDPAKQAVGLLHAGWRGAAQDIVARGISAMGKAFGSDPEDLVAGVGPGINTCCFEVGEEVREAFIRHQVYEQSLWERHREGRCYFDLKRTIYLMLRACGVMDSKIDVAEECTSCSQNLFFSHRRENGRTGRMAALLGLKTSG